MTMYNEDEVLFCRTMNAWVNLTKSYLWVHFDECCRSQVWSKMLPISVNVQNQRLGGTMDGRKLLFALYQMVAIKSTNGHSTFSHWFVPFRSHGSVCWQSYQMGCYQEGIAKDSVAGKDVTAHIFEFVSILTKIEVGDWYCSKKVHYEYGCYRHWRSFDRIMSCTGHILLEGAK